jgi:hypothetical protein
MDQVGLLAVIGLGVGVIYFAGRNAAGVTQTAFEGYFRGYRPDPWPHGVQEKDIAGHWDGGRTRTSAHRTRGGATGSTDGFVWVEQDQAEVRTLMRPPSLRIVPVRDYRVESHI